MYTIPTILYTYLQRDAFSIIFNVFFTMYKSLIRVYSIHDHTLNKIENINTMWHLMFEFSAAARQSFTCYLHATVQHINSEKN